MNIAKMVWYMRGPMLVTSCRHAVLLATERAPGIRGIGLMCMQCRREWWQHPPEHPQPGRR